MSTRAEHLAWVKERALAELDAASRGGPIDAMTSIISDMTKHDLTRRDLAFFRAAGEFTATHPDEAQVRAFIEGLE
jgi:hypothetical protein